MLALSLAAGLLPTPVPTSKRSRSPEEIDALRNKHAAKLARRAARAGHKAENA